MINVEHLKKSFGTLEVLKDVNVEILPKEVVVVIGPSGSGKSTFLRCLNGLEVTTGGKITILGTDITSGKVNIPKICQKVGMVFQRFNLFQHLTVLENITIGDEKC